MTAVKIAPHISHFTGAPENCDGSGTTIAELIHDLDKRYQGLASYLINENGTLRQHVDILIDDRPVSDRDKLMDSVQMAEQVVLKQSVSMQADSRPS